MGALGKRIKCDGYRNHGKFHTNGNEKVVVGMEMMSRSPDWEHDPNQDHLDWSAGHSSNYGLDSY